MLLSVLIVSAQITTLRISNGMIPGSCGLASSHLQTSFTLDDSTQVGVDVCVLSRSKSGKDEPHCLIGYVLYAILNI